MAECDLVPALLVDAGQPMAVPLATGSPFCGGHTGTRVYRHRQKDRHAHHTCTHHTLTQTTPIYYTPPHTPYIHHTFVHINLKYTLRHTLTHIPTMLTCTLSHEHTYPTSCGLNSHTFAPTPQHTHSHTGFHKHRQHHIHSHTLLYFAVGTHRAEVALCPVCPPCTRLGKALSSGAGGLREGRVSGRTVNDDRSSFRPALVC